MFIYVSNNPVDNLDVYGLADSPPGPGIGDQFNPFGVRGTTGQKDYTEWFEARFPKSTQGAKSLLSTRIKEKICANRSATTIPPLVSGPDDVDIDPDMRRFGDKPQSWWERNVKIGAFEYKADQIKVRWFSCGYFVFSAVMYVEEQTGANEIKNPYFVPRTVRMAEWTSEGSGSCP